MLQFIVSEINERGEHYNKIILCYKCIIKMKYIHNFNIINIVNKM